jgi:hypothetical protein
MNNASIYDFVMRGLLTEEALDRAGRQAKRNEGLFDPEIAKALSLDRFDDIYLVPATKMAAVYIAVASFENSIRKLIIDVIEQGTKDPDWWENSIPEPIRRKAEGRMKGDDAIKWHTPRGAHPIYYTELDDLRKIIQAQWALFDPLLGDYEWASSTIKVIERSRNVIMHSGQIAYDDIRRIGYYIRDWIAQVGA